MTSCNRMKKAMKAPDQQYGSPQLFSNQFTFQSATGYVAHPFEFLLLTSRWFTSSFREQQFPGRQKSKCLRRSLLQPSQSNLFLCLSAASDPHTGPLQCLVSLACALLWMYWKQGKMQYSLVFMILKRQKRVVFQIAVYLHRKLFLYTLSIWGCMSHSRNSQSLSLWNFKCFSNCLALTALILSTHKKQCLPVVESIWVRHLYNALMLWNLPSQSCYSSEVCQC